MGEDLARLQQRITRLQQRTKEKDLKLESAHRQALEQLDKLRRLEEQRDDLEERLQRSEEESDGLRAQLAEARADKPLPVLPQSDVPVFFVVGHDKSGTTWIMNMLDSHPETLCRGEGRFFERNFRRGASPETLDAEHLDTLQPSSLYGAISSSEHLRTWVERSVWTENNETDRHLKNLSRLAINYFLIDRLSKTDKKIVGDKTPFAYAENLSEISGIYPEAKVIHIIRDGRDVAVSMIHHMWNYAKEAGGFYELRPEELELRDRYRSDPASASGKGLFTEHRLRTIARNWRTQVGKAVEYGPALLGENYLEVRYESVLEKPEKEVGRILGFLGADAGGTAVRGCIEAGSFVKQTKGRGRGQEDSSSFFRKGVAGDWRETFTDRDRQIFKQEAGDLLLQLGYEKDDGW